MSRRGIGVLHDDQAATRVLNKDCHRPIADAALVDLTLDITGDFVRALAVGTNLELIMVDAHWIKERRFPNRRK